MTEFNGAARSRLMQLWDMLDLITPMAIRVAGTLRVADHIQEGRDSLPQLAAATGAHPDALRRLLRYLVARDVFTEPEPDRFGLTGLSELLTDGHPAASRGWMDLEGFGGRMDLAFFQLLETVRTGAAAEGWRDHLRDEQVAASYDEIMEAQSRMQASAIADAHEWPETGHIVDVGGGTGTLLVHLLHEYPRLRGTLLELPHAADRADAVITEAGLTGRCDVLTGDLNDVQIPAADVYLFKFVWHAFDDDGVVRALRRCTEAGSAGSRVVVIEHSAEPGDDRGGFTSMDLRMLVLGEGRERTVDEYAALGAHAGLELGAVTPTPDGLHIIELRHGG
ncbi:MAG: methyltransferase [Stackebrandtia sp.]